MGIITKQMVHKSYEIGKQIYQKKISRSEGLKVLTDLGMENSSANYYIYHYLHLINGNLFTGTINNYATDYYLNRILEDNGFLGLDTALHSLSLHLDYYEEKSNTLVIKKREIYDKYDKILKNSNYSSIIYADEVASDKNHLEGKTKKVLVNVYERNPVARKKCIEHYGLNCQVCGFNFEETFGKIGKDYIHVHHKVDISTIGEEYSVDPIKDLVPVCPNCHSMLHKKKPAYTIEELKQKLKTILRH